MAEQIPLYRIKAFMAVLLPIQARMIRKYGYNTVNGWRNERLRREKWQI